MLVVGAGFNNGDIISTLAAFLILLFLLRKFAWGPLLKIMKDREDYVANEIGSAEKLQADAKALVAQQQAALKEAQVEIQALRESARKTVEEQKEEIITAARAEANRLKEAAKLEIEQEKQQAVAALREQVASLSVLVASKVIEKELSEADQAKLIEDYIKEVGEVR